MFLYIYAFGIIFLTRSKKDLEKFRRILYVFHIFHENHFADMKAF